MSNTLIKQVKEELAVFQDYSASLGFPMNQEAHEKGLKIATDKLIKAFTEAIDRAEPSFRVATDQCDEACNKEAELVADTYNEAVRKFKSNIKEEIGEVK